MPPAAGIAREQHADPICAGTGWFISDAMPGAERYSLGRAGTEPGVPAPSTVVIGTRAWQRLLDTFTAPVWTVEAESSAEGFAFRLIDDDGETAIEADFNRRIELAASQSSPSGRFLVFVQANNIASEVTILDAMQGDRWSVALRHDAGLAAYAISIEVDSTERCLAIGQVRADGSPAQTWFIDLESHAVAGPVEGFVVGWLG